MSSSLWPHGLQHTRLSCPSLSPGVCSHSYPLSQWCYLTNSTSAVPFSFCLQSFPASGFFPMSRLFASGGQSIEALASASVLPMRWWRIKITMKKMTVKCWSGWWWWQYSDVYWAHAECQVIVSEPNLHNFTCFSKQALWVRYLCGFCL